MRMLELSGCLGIAKMQMVSVVIWQKFLHKVLTDLRNWRATNMETIYNHLTNT